MRFPWSRDEPKNTVEIDDPLLSALLKKQAVTKQTALSIPAVSAAVEKITNVIACTPFYLYKEIDGKVERVDDYRVRLVNDDGGDTLDALQTKKAFVRDYLLDKGGYIYIDRTGNKVRSLRYVEASNITVMQNDDPIFKRRTLQVYGRNHELYDFLIIARNTNDGASGIGLTAEIENALQTALGMVRYQLGIVSTGGNKKGFIKAQKRLSQEAIDALKTAWRQLYSDSSENVVVLNDGLEFQESSNTSLEMQLNQSKNSLNAEINSVFGISDNNEQFFKFAITPIVKAIETALNRNMLLESEKGNLYWAADLSEIAQADLKTRYEAWKIALESGWTTPNEIRYLENRDDIEGLDTINLSLGNVLLDTKTGKYFVPNTGQITGTGGE